jgi:Uma2 family endonuclease
MHEATHPFTAEELERRPDLRRFELLEGRLVEMSPVGFEHGHVVLQLGYLLKRHLRGRRLGAVGTEVGFKLASDPDTVRAPDLAFIRQDRLPPPRPRGFMNGPPDLAIEVLSPEDRPGEMREKVDEYLTRGVPLVVVVDPDERTVTLHPRGASATTLSALDDVLDLSLVIDGFRCRLEEIFE